MVQALRRRPVASGNSASIASRVGRATSGSAKSILPTRATSPCSTRANKRLFAGADQARRLAHAQVSGTPASGCGE